MKNHADEKKYKCTFCTKSFRRRYEVNHHERLHTGDKPYRCTVCFKHFANYPNWTKHLTRAHGFNKDNIKQLREAHKQADFAAKSSPAKTESGIESAGSEISDLNAFLESDDSADERDGPNLPIAKIEREINMVIQTTDSNENITKTIKKDENIFGSHSMSDTVDAVINSIDTIDEDYDLMTTPIDLHGDVDLNTTTTDFSTDFNDVIDDSSDIKAIVEHIDALSGGMEMQPTKYTSHGMTEPEYYQPTSLPLEYGPDFTSLGSVVYTDLVNMDDHVLPHIDPLLTIKDEPNAQIVLQNLHNLQNNLYEMYEDPGACDQDWQPNLSKVFSYEEANENRIILYRATGDSSDYMSVSAGGAAPAARALLLPQQTTYLSIHRS
ncbi:Wings down [Operophtera brumata]|uniref:Wings down n=1 Tax=Operophtera brumata TaxID=104452 RepID=A0A0L7LJ14_OPEBR|nr:Wings down [Operophtera brumata]